MQFEDVYIAIRVSLQASAVEAQLPCPPQKIGQELARMCDAYVRYHRPGYYPAIEFFNDVEGVDRDILELAEQAAWLGSKRVREEIQKKLRPIFASISFQSIQTVAYAMPTVRPGHDNAIEQLARHYTPDTFRVELKLSMMRKDTDDREGQAEAYARKMIFRWLGDSFRDVEITGSSSGQ